MASLPDPAKFGPVTVRVTKRYFDLPDFDRVLGKGRSDRNEELLCAAVGRSFYLKTLSFTLNGQPSPNRTIWRYDGNRDELFQRMGDYLGLNVAAKRSRFVNFLEFG